MRILKNKSFLVTLTITVVLATAVLTIGIGTKGFSFFGSDSVVVKVSDEISKNNADIEESLLDVQIPEDENLEDISDNSDNNEGLIDLGQDVGESLLEEPVIDQIINTEPENDQNASSAPDLDNIVSEIISVSDDTQENLNTYSGKIAVEDIVAAQVENSTTSGFYSQYPYMDIKSIEDVDFNYGNNIAVDTINKNVIKVIIKYIRELSNQYFKQDSADKNLYYAYIYDVTTGTETRDEFANSRMARFGRNFFFDRGRIISYDRNNKIKTVAWPLLSVKTDDGGVPYLTKANIVYIETWRCDNSGNKIEVLNHTLNGGYDVDGSKNYEFAIPLQTGQDEYGYSNLKAGIYSGLENNDGLKNFLNFVLNFAIKNAESEEEKTAVDDFIVAMNKEDGGMFYTGFVADLDNGIFTTGINAPAQRNAGFTASSFYDNAAAFGFMTYDTFRLKFNSSGLKWMFQPWKGQYGVLCGSEVGIYYTDGAEDDPQRKTLKDMGLKDSEYGVNDCITDSKILTSINNLISKSDNTIYSCVSDPYLLTMSYSLYRKDQNKNPELVFYTGEKEHWWLTTFRLGNFTDPSTLTLDVEIKFENSNGNLYKNNFAGLEKSGNKIRYTEKFFNDFVAAILDESKIDYDRNTTLLDKLAAHTYDYLSVYEIDFDARSVRFIWGNPKNMTTDTLDKFSRFEGLLSPNDKESYDVQQAYFVKAENENKISNNTKAALEAANPNFSVNNMKFSDF